jgi:Lipocalin-like domain
LHDALQVDEMLRIARNQTKNNEKLSIQAGRTMMIRTPYPAIPTARLGKPRVLTPGLRVIIALSVFLVSGAGNPTLSDGNASRFCGTWSLVSWEARAADGTVAYPFGKDAQGRLMYDQSGHMMVQLMRRNRPAFASNDPLAGSPAEVKTAFEDTFSYYGTYEVDDKKGIVTHHLEGCSFPNWTGTDQPRFFEFRDERLHLATPPLMTNGKALKHVLIWKKESR